MEKRRFIALLLAAMFGGPLPAVGASAQQEPLLVVYPAPESPDDKRDLDMQELLKLALDHTVASHGPYRLQASEPMNENRYRASLRHGVKISLAWLSVTAETERDFLPVRIPLRRGILGYRVFIIRKQDQARFAAIHSASQLKALRMGQGTGWNDVPLLRANGFNVAIGASYASLFEQLANGRVDYLSRGINEAWQEVAAFRAQYPELMVEPTLMLYYPWPKYLYVNRKDRALAQRLQLGLTLAQQDGSFEQLFRRYHQQDIGRADFARRQVFCVDNQLFPNGFPAESQRWLFRPDESFPCLRPLVSPDKKQ